MSTLPKFSPDDWRPTRTNLHGYVRAIGAIRARVLAPRAHMEDVGLPLFVRGFTSGRLHRSGVTFSIGLDLTDHTVAIGTRDGSRYTVPLTDGLPVDEFERKLQEGLVGLGIEPFQTPRLQTHSAAGSSYDCDAASRFFRVVDWSDAVFSEFAKRSDGWPTPSLFRCERFELDVPSVPCSWRDAPTPSLQLSFGFRPDDGNGAVYYSNLQPASASLVDQPHSLAEWLDRDGCSVALFPYDAVRAAPDPKATLLFFLNAVCESVAHLQRSLS